MYRIHFMLLTLGTAFTPNPIPIPNATGGTQGMAQNVQSGLNAGAESLIEAIPKIHNPIEMASSQTLSKMSSAILPPGQGYTTESRNLQRLNQMPRFWYTFPKAQLETGGSIGDEFNLLQEELNQMTYDLNLIQNRTNELRSLIKEVAPLASRYIRRLYGEGDTGAGRSTVMTRALEKVEGSLSPLLAENHYAPITTQSAVARLLQYPHIELPHSRRAFKTMLASPITALQPTTDSADWFHLSGLEDDIISASKLALLQQMDPKFPERLDTLATV